ncbi:DUF3322 domain-containing protein [Actinomyces slackii]|uniref:Uncharacterized protein conserved in bacteria n=1 Tax=Actinomyces slackii TaxID=52774 RepID=A0A3S4SND5_9ACTO|nr:DUF3322 domain-containing protein [Actinomyces slackii]VEG74050.1 Uncharacterized protein conserved in bacteria [Actinomyces slackii]
MRTPADLAARAAVRYRRGFAAWAVDPAAAQAADVVLALAPPTQSAALADAEAVATWMASWRRWEQQGLGTVERQERRWPSLGIQQVPVRVQVVGAEAIARTAGRSEHWALVRERGAYLLAELADVGASASGAVAPASTAGEDLAQAVAAVIGEVADYPDDDVERLAAAVRWLAKHPASGLYLRQLPIAGLDTKWLEQHRRVVARLLASVRGVPREGLDLGLRRVEAVLRLRVLDQELAVGGLEDVSVPVGQAGRLWPGRRLDVVIVENLATFLALEPRGGAVAVWGAGKAVVSALTEIAWVRGARRLVYWGDLDADGLAIFGALAQRLRGEEPSAQCVDLTPVLMDAATLRRYRPLAVADPGAEGNHDRAVPAGLGEGERQAWQMVVGQGVRLEQERIPWPEAQAAVEAAFR